MEYSLPRSALISSLYCAAEVKILPKGQEYTTAVEISTALGPIWQGGRFHGRLISRGSKNSTAAAQDD